MSRSIVEKRFILRLSGEINHLCPFLLPLTDEELFESFTSQLIGSFIVNMTLESCPLNLAFCVHLIQSIPQICIFDGFLGRMPVSDLPAFEPVSNPQHCNRNFYHNRKHSNSRQVPQNIHFRPNYSLKVDDSIVIVMFALYVEE
ncbi:MAG: hypothetical protein V1897_12235 [Pseudomonadota bacterium]